MNSLNDNLFQGKQVRLSAEEPEALAKMFSRWDRDSEYVRMLDSDPARLVSEKRIKAWWEKDLEEDPPKNYFFSIRTLEGDLPIGIVLLFLVNWKNSECWVGIGIGEKEYRGRGYGSDAMRTILRYAFDELGMQRVTLIVYEYNPRAIHTYEKIGFQHEGRTRGEILREGRRWDVLYMGLLRDEWEQGKDYRE